MTSTVGIRLLNSSIKELKSKRERIIKQKQQTKNIAIANTLGQVIHNLNSEIKEKQQAVDKIKAGEDIGPRKQQAKQVDIRTILTFKNKKTTCLWHLDKSPSLSYNAKNNTVKCFSCGHYSDAIGVYMKLHGVSFLRAIESMV